MSETALTALQAADEIRRMQQFPDALRRRTSGLSWMIWGLAIPGLFVTYSYWGVVVDNYAPDAGPVFAILWIPWIAMGVISMIVLWRSAALVIPALNDRRRAWLTPLVFVVVIQGGFGLMQLLPWDMVEPAISLIVVGLATIMAGLTGLIAHDRQEKTLAALAGGLLIAFAVIGTLLWQASDTAYAVLGSLGPLAIAIAYFGTGLVVASRA